jgi:hypothetical protein
MGDLTVVFSSGLRMLMSGADGVGEGVGEVVCVGLPEDVGLSEGEGAG